MSASAETLFMAANAQYQTSIKWRWLTFLLLLFLQFFIVRPYVELGEVPALPAPELAAAQAASNTDALIAALEPFIKREVVQPRLALFNAAWSDEARPLAEGIEGTRASLAETRRKFAAEAGG